MVFISPDTIREHLDLVGLLAVAIHSRNSQSAGGMHWFVQLSEPVPLMAAVCLQAALGDDTKRVMLNFMRVKDCHRAFVMKDWNVLYDAKIVLDFGGLEVEEDEGEEEKIA